MPASAPVSSSSASASFPRWLEPIASLGRSGLGAIHTLGQLWIFCGEIFLTIFRLGVSPSKVAAQIWEIGVKCIPLVALVGFFTGMVLALQLYIALSRFGAESMLGAAVAISLIRELAPVFGAVLIVGQAGSAMTAEIASQRNSEQIDALQTMGINPLRFLIAPRLVAALLSFPILAAFFATVGLYSGFWISTDTLGLPAGTYWSSVTTGVNPDDIFDGFTKPFFFAIIVIAICSFEGFYTHLRSGYGSRGVSISATRAVVTSTISILAADYLLTAFMS